MPGLTRNNPCTLFESEIDYVQQSPQRVVGADGLGNHIGWEVFHKQTYIIHILDFVQSAGVPPTTQSQFVRLGGTDCLPSAIILIKSLNLS
jgi:hypothetical protein